MTRIFLIIYYVIKIWMWMVRLHWPHNTIHIHMIITWYNKINVINTFVAYDGISYHTRSWCVAGGAKRSHQSNSMCFSLITLWSQILWSFCFVVHSFSPEYGSFAECILFWYFPSCLVMMNSVFIDFIVIHLMWIISIIYYFSDLVSSF